MAFRINASEVAGLVGKNPYKSQEEAIQDCINRNRHGLPPQEFMKAREVCKKNKEVEKLYNVLTDDAKKTETTGEVTAKKVAFTESVKKEMTKSIDEQIGEAYITYDDEMSKAASIRDERGITRDFHKHLDELKVQKASAEHDAAEIAKAATTRMNTNFGTRKEDAVADMYEAQTGDKVYKPNRRYDWEIAPGFKVVGKFDGFTDSGKLVEIKNRVRRLFGEVKEYESVQVHVYMKMAEVDTAHLVERFEDKINILDVFFDDDLMCDVEGELERVIKEYLSK
tara:strand:+ start:1091 stop:1936 length:846 start_codon:yes stop_codon:yes gene_type:complete